jgi:hypothetical protein
VIAASDWGNFAASAGLVILGAVLTGLLVPFITRRWQNHQKELELKVDLLRRTSDAVTRIVTHGWFTRLAGTTWGSASDRIEFTWGYGEWLTQTRGLEAELQAYYQADEAIWRQWESYCRLLRAFHELTWEEDVDEAERRAKRIRWLRTLKTLYEHSPELWSITAHKRAGLRTQRATYAAIPVPDVKWQAFLDTGNSREYIVDQWPTLKEALEAPLGPLAAAILGTPMKPLTAWRS